MSQQPIDLMNITCWVSAISFEWRTVEYRGNNLVTRMSIFTKRELTQMWNESIYMKQKNLS